jgi:mRNA interferase MazF
MQRGEIWWASLPAPRGSGPGYRRPVVVVQADSFNRSRIQTVMVVPITSNLKIAASPGNVPLSKRESKLGKDSVINLSQVITLDRSFLTERVSRLPGRASQALDEGLRLALSL